MALPQATDLEYLGSGGTGGTQLRDLRQNVISGVTATRTLLPEESGSLCLFDSATLNIIYTLPTPVAGMVFDFFVSVEGTSGTFIINTKIPGSEFILGAVFIYDDTITESDGFQANGSTHVSIDIISDATGQGIGTQMKLVAISTTQWAVTGTLHSISTAGTIPFATA